MGLVAIALVFVLVTMAASRVVRVSGLTGRAESLLATFVVSAMLFAVPLEVLAWLRRMTASSVVIAVVVLAVAAMAWTKPKLGDVLSALRGAADWIVLPLRATGLAARDGSFMLALLPLALLFCLSMTVQAVLLPPPPSVHEALIGLVVQARGLDGAGELLFRAPPRLGELVMAWVAQMTDHRFIDVPSVLVAAPLVLSMATLARSASSDATCGAAWGLALLWVPSMALMLQTTQVELLATAFAISAAVFATKSVHHAYNVWLANAACALAIATSTTAVIPSLVLAAVLVARVLAAKRFVHLLAALVPTVAFATSYSRSLGPRDFAKTAGVKLADWLEAMLAWSAPHGMTVGWVLVPLGAVTTLALAVLAIKSAIAAIAKRPRWAPDAHAHAIMIVGAAALPSVFFAFAAAPAMSFVTIALFMGLVAWLTRSWTRLGREIATAAAIASLVSFAWHAQWWGQSGRVVLTYKELAVVAAMPDRELVAGPEIDPRLGPAVGSGLVATVAKTRDKTIGPGSIVAFTGTPSSAAVAALWNGRYENRVLYVPAGADYVARVKASNAAWVYASGAEKDELCANGFVAVGPIVTGDGGTIVRRADW